MTKDSTKKPWEINFQLTEERLRDLAEPAVRVRARCLALHDPDEGDDPWSLGCRVYARLCATYARMALSDKYPWLRTQRKALYFVLYVDGIPVRFYSGDPGSTRKSFLATTANGVKEYLTQTQLNFSLVDDEPGWFWLIAIESLAGGGEVARVVIHQAREAGGTQNHWAIPIDGNITQMAPVVPILREGVELDPPEVGLPSSSEESESSDDGQKG